MNEDTVKGTGQDIGGKIKETVGDITGDNSLKGEGLADQLSGKAQKAIGSVKEAISGDGGPTIEKFKQFARDRPFATVAAIGVVGVALLNTLRGKK